MKKLLKILLRYSQVYRENEELKAQVTPLKQHATAAYDELARAWESVHYLTDELTQARAELRSTVDLCFKQQKEISALKKELAARKQDPIHEQENTPEETV